MQKIKLFTDSTSDLSKQLLNEHRIDVVPLSVVFADKAFKDGQEINTEKMYNIIDENGKLPKTSAPSPQDFIDAFKPYIDDGYEIIYIGLSSDLSVTCQNASLASQSLDGKVHVVDSKNLSTGIGLLVLKAADFINEGFSSEEVAQKVRNLVEKVETEFVINTLEYLHKGGRCSGVQNFVGNMLKIRPVVKVVDGGMILAQKTRGKRKKALKTLLKNALKNKKEITEDRIFVTHSMDSEGAEYLKAELEKEVKGQVIITDAGCVISSHCGPKTVGILYIKK
ncbi:DegV family protein [Proteinivorax hydrogeniformans]|uniref:DegV family protein n=1 Tax=Proteinivorax hydrogeniformans TaxID=1826727 RepID=A0AAU8HS66_9FIRM